MDSDGTYQVTVGDVGWQFAGRAGAGEISGVATDTGTDGVGDYAEITFDYTAGAARHASIRLYQDRSAVLFSVTNPDPAPNNDSFPAFTIFPPGLRHLTFSGAFAAPSFPGLGRDGPWVFFDSSANTFILSPASDFMVSNTSWNSSSQIVTGIAPQITGLPAGFTHQTLLAFAHGINAAFDLWGHTLTGVTGKQRPSNWADVSLLALGYWTDSGATYYYRTEPSTTYPNTLSEVVSSFANAGLHLAYMQLDSWFYPKGPNADWRDGADGIYQYVGAPALFNPDLHTLQAQLGMPLVTHARWIDASSPYFQQYRASGSVIVDPDFWDKIATFLQNSGVKIFEQDWLNDRAIPNFNLSDPEAFMGNMAHAMAAHGITVQYCMAAPRHILESTRYDNVITVRTSQDRFNRSRWANFLYASRFAGAVGLWPFADNLRSTETDNLLLATLSAGPLGLNDAVGAVDAHNVLRAVRPDGIIVKPDVPIVPLDAAYLRDSMGMPGPLVASTYTDFDGLRMNYVFAFARDDTNTLASFSPSELGMSGRVYLYNYFSGAGKLLDAAATFADPLGNANGWAYYILAPVGSSGIAFLGDMNQFVGTGKPRIAAVQDVNGTLRVTMSFTSGEPARVLHGYAPARPWVRAIQGSAADVVYDASTQRFRVSVAAGAGSTAVLEMGTGDTAAAASQAPHWRSVPRWFRPMPATGPGGRQP